MIGWNIIISPYHYILFEFIDDILMDYIYYSLPDKALWLMFLNIIWIGLAFGSIITWTSEAKKNNNLNNLEN